MAFLDTPNLHMRHNRRMVAQILVVLVSYVPFQAAGEQAHAHSDNPLQQAGEAPTPPPTSKILLKEGMKVALKFAQKLSAKSAFVGEPVELVWLRT